MILHSSVGSADVHSNLTLSGSYKRKNQSVFYKKFRASIALRAMSAFG